jgi:hypothetical protein
VEDRKKYNAFKRRLLEGLEVLFLDAKSGEAKDATLSVDLKEPKFLVIRGPKLQATLKFDLMFLYKVHTGWSTPSLKAFPRDAKPPKDITLSLEGKITVDLATKGTIDDARYAREEYAMCFRRLMLEMNSSESIYRDASGNRVRVLASVFAPLPAVVLTSAKDNQVKLAGKNLASLYKIQHKFTRHKQKIDKGQAARSAAASAAAAAALTAASAQAAGRATDAHEVESRPSAMSDLSLMTDEADFALDPSRWGKQTAPKRFDFSAEEEAEAAKRAVMARRAQGAKYGGQGAAYNDDDDDDDDDDDEEEFDDQATYTEYTETKEDGRGDLLDDSDDE